MKAYNMKSTMIIGVILLLCFGSLNIVAQTSSIPAAFVDVGYGARPVAMGSAYSGLADDINALFWNPAGLNHLTDKQAAFTTANILGVVRYNILSYAMPLKFGEAQQGGGIALISSGDDALREFTLLAGYSRRVAGLDLGLNLKYRYASFGKNSLDRSETEVFSDAEFLDARMNQVHGSANGFGMDLGVLYQLNEKIRCGLMVRDLFSPVSWNSAVDNTSLKTKGKYTENVPTEIIVGTSYKVFDEFLVTADYQPALTKDVNNMIRGGAELCLLKHFFVRAGLQDIVNDQPDEKYVFGLGFQLNIGKGSGISFDYTYVIEELDNSNRLTVGLTF
jgi:hypothetical protein